MKKSTIILVIMLIFGIFQFIIPIYWSHSFLNPNNSTVGLLVSILFYAVFGIFGLYYRLEENEISNKEVALIAVYSAFTAVSRIPFLPFPSFQPCTFFIFIAGYVFGPLIGFIIGTNTALLSNFLAGQGPWTVFQMIAWGVVGIIGGWIRAVRIRLLRKTSAEKYMNSIEDKSRPDLFLDGKFRIMLSIIGFFLGILYGWIMNIWSWIVWIPEHTWRSWMIYYLTSLPYDIIHGIGNMFFIYFLGNRTIAILERYRARFFVVIQDIKS